MSEDRTRMKVYQDEAKLRHTSHWDMDYMTQEQIESLYRGEGQWPGGETPRPTQTPRPGTGPDAAEYRRLMKVVAGTLAVVLALIGVLLLLR